MKRAASKDKEKDESFEDEGPACQSCRKKKAKCSREQPCSHCARMNIECQYDESRSRPGVKAGVIESLSQRLDTLEKMFIGQTLVTRQLLSTIRELNPNLGTQSPGSLVQLSDCGSPSKPLDLLTAEISGLKRELLQASSPATSGSGGSAKRQRLNNHHDVSPRSYQQPTSDPELSQQRRPMIVDLLDCEDSSLPPADLVDILVHLYFELIHPWIPILHKTSFLRRLESVTTRPALSTILHAIVAATVRFSADKRLERKEVRDRFFKISRQTVILKSMEMFSVENLQALVIIAFDTIGSGKGPKSWAIVDSMTRTVEHLQLSFEDDAEANTGNSSAHRLINRMNFLGPSKTWTEGEERRRVFWNVFLLDRFCSVATGWNTSLTSADVRRRLPCEGAIWEAEKPVRTRYFGISDNSGTQNIRRQNGGAPLISDPFPSDPANNSNGFYSDEVVNLGGFSYCIEATELLSQVTRFFLQQAVDLKSPEEVQQWLMRFKELDLRLVRWKLFLPPQWREATVTNGKMDPNLTLAHITHNTSVILLHQGIAYPSIQWQTLSIKLPSSSSADTCLSAAVEITTITQQYLIHNTGLTNPQFAFCLFVSGRVLLAHASFYNTELRPEFVTLVKALFDISKRWHGLYVDHDNAYNLPAGFAQRLLQAQAQSDPKNTLFSDSAATGSVDISKPAYSDHFDSDEFLQMTGKGLNGKNGQNIEPEPLELASPPMPLSFQAPASHVGNVNHPYGDNLEHPQNQHFDNGYNGVIDHSDGGIFTVEQLAEFSNLFADPQFAGFDRVLTYGGGM